MEQKLPVQFGQYFLYDRIGLGGMAEIFLAKRVAGLGAELQSAIKRILPTFVTNDSFGEMLISEAKLCAKLTHANIVTTNDLGKVDGLYYIAMEYVEGFDLNRLLGLLARAKQALPLQFAIYIIREALRGLDYAHRFSGEDGEPLGIIHRDVSPTNILISTEGEVKLCDFGIAKVALSDEGASQIDEYHLKGKIAYMSPEHLNGEDVDRRADIYAAGILLWELLSGRRMFKSKDEEETLRRAKAADVPPLQDRGFPEFQILESIVMKALSRDRTARFQTGLEFINALEDYVHASKYLVSQLKFSDFLMENFGESLLEQRRERERSLQELEAYKTTLEAEKQRSSLPPPQVQEEENWVESLIGTFSEPPGPEYEGDETGADNQEESSEPIEDRKESPKTADAGEEEIGDIEVELELGGTSLIGDSQPTSEHPEEEAENAGHSTSVQSVWQPDLKPGKAGSSAWVVAGMAAALVAAAIVIYFYLN